MTSHLQGEVVPLTRTEVDITQAEQLRQILASHQPDVVINCTAYNFVDQAEAEPEAAFTVNAWAVRNLAMVCEDLNCTLMHFSSDYVFGGNPSHDQPLSEECLPAPVSVYGMSKLTGEHCVSAYCRRHFIIRTCGLYGHQGKGGKGGNFVRTMLRLSESRSTLSVVDDQICTPSYTRDVAAASIRLLSTERYGLYHATNEGSCSWNEFAQAIFQIANCPIKVQPISSAEFGAKARRPAFSALSTAKLQSLGIVVRPWREALANFFDEERSV